MRRGMDSSGYFFGLAIRLTTPFLPGRHPGFKVFVKPGRLSPPPRYLSSCASNRRAVADRVLDMKRCDQVGDLLHMRRQSEVAGVEQMEFCGRHVSVGGAPSATKYRSLAPQ